MWPENSWSKGSEGRGGLGQRAQGFPGHRKNAESCFHFDGQLWAHFGRDAWSDSHLAASLSRFLQSRDCSRVSPGTRQQPVPIQSRGDGGQPRWVKDVGNRVPFCVHLTVKRAELLDELIRCECDGKQEVMGDFGNSGLTAGSVVIVFIHQFAGSSAVFSPSGSHVRTWLPGEQHTRP